MATDTLTNGDPAPKNHLGHPCQLAIAFDRFQPVIEEVEQAGQSTATLLQDIARSLASLCDKGEQVREVMRAAGAQLSKAGDESADALSASALIAVSIPFQLATSNELYDMAGKILTVIKRGGIEEVNHG
jgi:hypothetical protein